MIGPPLREFADRIARNREYEQFCQALVENGGDMTALERDIAKVREIDAERPSYIHRKQTYEARPNR